MKKATEIISNDPTKIIPPTCKSVFRPHFFIKGIVKAAAIAEKIINAC